MSKQEGQKQRILLLYRILARQSDSEHPLPMARILQELERAGVRADRRSVYSDLAALRQAEIEVEWQRGADGGYWLASRRFSLPECKLMADAVAAARFLTEKKSRDLLRKIAAMGSRWEASQISHQLYVVNRAHAANEQVYYNVDTLHQAIAARRRVCFQYFHYNMHRQKVYKYGGEPYEVSPYALCWDNAFYYLIGLYERSGSVRNFRLDRMEHIQLLDAAVRAQPPDLDLAAYAQRSFSMFGGEQVNVTLAFCGEKLVGPVLDRFGLETRLHSWREPGWFCLTAEVALSPPFFGWLLQFGGAARIVSPESARAALRQHLAQCVEAAK